MANRTRYTDRISPGSVRDPGLKAPWWPEDTGVISDLIEYTDVSSGTATVEIGTLPAGARFLGCKVWVVTAFNAGANDALIVGISSDTNYFIEDGNPTVANSETTEVNVLDYTPTSDTAVSAIYTHTSTAPTAGKALVSVYFKQPL